VARIERLRQLLLEQNKLEHDILQSVSEVEEAYAVANDVLSIVLEARVKAIKEIG